MKLTVEGMTCSHCEKAITRAITALGGTARVDVAGGTVEVEGVDDVAPVIAAIEEEGYRVVAREGGAASTKADGDCCGTCHT